MHLNVGVIGEPLFNPLGGSSLSAGWIGQTTLALELSPGLERKPAQWREIDHWKLKVTVNQYGGNAGYGEQIGALFPCSRSPTPAASCPVN